MSHLSYNVVSLRESMCSSPSPCSEFYDDGGAIDSELEDRTKEDFPYHVMDICELERQHSDSTKRVAELLNVSLPVAELLLISCKWKYEVLQTLYWDNPEAACNKAGVLLDSPFGTPVSTSTAVVTCLICFEEVPMNQTYTLACGHSNYCQSCWSQYIHEQLQLGRFLIRCFMPKCTILLHDGDIRFLGSADDHSKFRQFITRDHVDTYPKLKWCPNPRSCGKVVEYTGFDEPTEVLQCECGFWYCFRCGHEKHDPASCTQVKLWDERAMDPSAQLSLKFIRAETKECPKCKKPILKDGGCNHMTCSKPTGCGMEFCWLCRGPWSEHGSHTGGFYSCNKYESSDAKKLDVVLEKEKEELKRYVHYYNRYFNYDADLKKGPEKLQKVKDKTIVFRQDDSRREGRWGMNPDFLVTAVELELNCRSFLKYTYIFSYFLKDNTPEKDFFLFQQANVEGITERLADMNNKPLAELDDNELRNYIRVTEKYLENMNECLKNFSIPS